MASPAQPFYLPITTPFYQPVLPMPLAIPVTIPTCMPNTGIHTSSSGITHSQFIWMIRLLVPPGLSRNNYSTEYIHHMSIQPTANESITMTVACHLIWLSPHPRYFRYNIHCAMYRYYRPFTGLVNINHSLRSTNSKHIIPHNHPLSIPSYVSSFHPLPHPTHSQNPSTQPRNQPRI